MKKVSTVVANESRDFSQPKLTIGLDLGDRSNWYCVLDERGELQGERRVSTTAKAMREAFQRMPRSRLSPGGAAEAGQGRRHADRADLLADPGVEEKSTNRWQHRLQRERPTCTERKSLTQSADGRMATVATRAESKPCR